MSHQEKVCLIDGSGFIFRAFHALPTLSRADGTPIHAVLGFVNILTKFLDQHSADKLAVIFDAGRRTFRHDIYSAYKANREAPPADLVVQFPLVREACHAFNVKMVEKEGVEADDLIATYATQAVALGAQVTIVSSDKDLMQLVNDQTVLLDPLKNKILSYEAVQEKFGVTPDKVIDVQALAGDSSDNVPGVPGIGIKTAAELINTFGDLETLLTHASSIKQPKRRQALIDHAEDARLSRQLVTLRHDVPVEMSLAELVHEPIDQERLRSFLQSQGFKSVLARLDTLAGVSHKEPGTSSLALSLPSTKVSSYELVTTLPQLETWIELALKVGKIAVDTETTSLNALQAELVGISLAIIDPIFKEKACYIPLGHTGLLSTQTQLPLELVLSKLEPLFTNLAVLKVGHNLKYDMLVLSRYNLTLTPIEDTMVMSYVLDGALHRHNLDELAQRHFGYKTITYEEVTGKGKKACRFDEVPLDQACAYAAEDADVTARLYTFLKPRLQEERLVSVYETIERPLIPILVEMEKNGVWVNPETLRHLSRDFEQRLQVLAEDIYKDVGHNFNIASPKQLGEILFEELSLPGGKKGKSGSYNTGADVLEELVLQGHLLPEKILRWRQLAKLKSTYTDALLEQINPVTHRVHTSYMMTVTSTGRLSSADPNLQNIPIRTEEGRKIRGAFQAPSGYNLMSVDYSQIELRLLAHVGNIEFLRIAFEHEADIHALTASQIFGIPLEQITPDIRHKAKAINFGIIYGISAFGLSQQLKISQSEAASYIKAYYKQYPGIVAYMDAQKEYAHKYGYVKTILGRRCYIPGINDRSATFRNMAERQAINAPLQGSNADIIKRAMIQIPGALKAAGLRAKMLLQVHDELLFEVAEGDEVAVGDLLKKIMETVVTLSIPLIAEVKIGKTWADAH